MINEKQSDVEILSTGNSEESIGMSLDLDSAQMLMQMLSKNLYSDGIGSTIRECASNALDSHRRAGVKDPIIVSFKINDSSNYEFSVEDFGVGLDDDDVANIISKYGKSTKRNSNTELGMFGLGFKSPLAYCSSFYFICRKNGVERKYMMYEGEDLNTIDLLYKKNTTEPNGVKVIIPVKWSDRYTFESKIKEQLAYFENVYFNCDGVDNKFTITRSEHFQISELSTDRNLHMCLDNVYYSIDFQKLGIETIEFPVALRFSLTDGIYPTPNREAIRITKETKEKILKKIQLVADYYINKFNEASQEITTYRELINAFSDRKIVTEGKVVLNVNSIAKYSTMSFISPKVKGVELLNVSYLYKNKRNDFDHPYTKKYELCRGKFRESNYYKNFADDDRCYVFTTTLTNQKKDYLRSTLPTGWNETSHFFKKTKSFTLFGREGECYNSVLSLHRHPKSEWRQRIKEFQIIEKMYHELLIDADKIEIPQTWIDDQKKKRNGGIASVRRERIKGNIIGKVGVPLERDVAGQYCKFVSDSFDLSKEYDTLMIYSTEDNKGYLDAIYSVSKEVKVVIFAPTQEAKMREHNLKNWITYDEFMEGNTIEFKRVVTAHVINELYQKYKSVFVKGEYLKLVSEDLRDKVCELETYRNKHYITYANDSFKQSMKTIADTHGLYDDEIHPLFLQIEALFKTLHFINPLFDSISHSYNIKYYGILVTDLFSYYSQSVNFEDFGIKMNKPITETLNEIV